MNRCIMKKMLIDIGLVAVMLFSCPQVADAQSKKQQKQLAALMQELETFQDCFDGQSKPDAHDAVYTLDGQEVSVVEQTDFTKGAFHFSQVTSDLNLRVAIMDGNDLSSWEIRNAQQICEEIGRASCRERV